MLTTNPGRLALAMMLFAVGLMLATGTMALLSVEHRGVVVVSQVLWAVAGYFFAKIPK